MWRSLGAVVQQWANIKQADDDDDYEVNNLRSYDIMINVSYVNCLCILRCPSCYISRTIMDLSARHASNFISLEMLFLGYF